MVVEKLLLTMREELRFSMWSIYCNGTFILKSTNCLPRPHEPPCTDLAQHDRHLGQRASHLVQLVHPISDRLGAISERTPPLSRQPLGDAVHVQVAQGGPQDGLLLDWNH